MKKIGMTIVLLSAIAPVTNAEVYLSGKLGYSHEKLEDNTNL